jgi:hypothetical protein
MMITQKPVDPNGIVPDYEMLQGIKDYATFVRGYLDGKRMNSVPAE